jgi:hypothetical protein
MGSISISVLRRKITEKVNLMIIFEKLLVGKYQQDLLQPE